MTDEQPSVEVLPDRTALAARAVEVFAATAARAVRETGRFTVALSGGTTPEPLYAHLASGPGAERVAWARTHVGWGDERCVPPTDPASNYRMASDALLRHVPVPVEQVHRIQGERDPGEAAAAYERELQRLFGAAQPSASFDLVLLGLGPDGHTASLFPGLAAVRERRRWVVAEHVPAVSMWRVTLTPAAINAAAEVVFLVAGADKASALARVLSGPRDPDRWPAQVVAPARGRTRWLVDAAAACGLRD
jgi:6-phosphogluconolactonase